MADRHRCVCLKLFINLFADGPTKEYIEVMKNYTSRMPVTESIDKIKSALKAIGFRSGNLTDTWVVGNQEAILCAEYGAAVAWFKFKPDIKSVQATLTGSDDKKKAQAEITAWRSMLDFIEIQCDRIMLKQSTAMGAFMEYIYYPQQGITLMERLKLPANAAMASKLLTG